MLTRLLVDFGLVILIWMTQLVVYPGFTFFESENLIQWHSRYTTAISIIVMPLMLAQLALHGYWLVQEVQLLRIVMLLLVLLAWVNTFFYAVPLHNKINMNVEVAISAKQLVSINWYRTGLWTIVFLLGVIDHFRKVQ